MSGGKGGSSTTVNAPDPWQVSAADFAFNRLNQITPTSSLTFYSPGQSPAYQQQVGFNRQFLTPTASSLFSQPTNGGQTRPPPNNSIQALGASGIPPSGARSPDARMAPSLPGSPSKGGQTGSMPAQPVSAQSGNIFEQLVRDREGNYELPASAMANLRPATAVQTLAPDLLALENARLSQSANVLAEGLRRQNEVAGGALPQLITSLNASNVPSGSLGGIPNPVAGLPTNPEQFRQDTINSMFELGAEPLRREFGRNIETIEQRLANQGLALGGEASSRVLSDFGREQDQALTNLALQSVLAGGQEASRGLQDIMGLQGQGFQQGLAANQQGFGQAESQRQARLAEQVQNAALAQTGRIAGLNELNVLLGLPQVGAPGLQNFLNTTPTGVTDAFGLNLAGQQANANMNANIKGSQLGALGQLGGAAATGMILSSRLFKEPIGPETSILERLKTVPVERWRYVESEDKHIGPYAEDFNRAFGLGGGLGIAIVDYLGVLLGAIKELDAKVEALRA